MTFDVDFAPSIEGAAETVLTASWSVGKVPHTTLVPLQASATPALWQVDEYRKPKPTPTDELVVIDNGPSMETRRDSLRWNLDAFARYLASSGIQTNLALVTVAGTSASRRAEFVSLSGRTVLDSNSPTFHEDVDALVDALEFRDSPHDTLATTFDALSPEALVGSNAGFWRDDAVLRILAITDHGDTSPRTGGDYAAELLAMKPSFLQEVSVIAPFIRTAAGTHVMEDEKLAEVVLMTRGVSEDLATPDWFATLEPVDKGDFPPLPFALSRHPSLTLEPLDVRIDGVSLVPIDSRGAPVWTYDPETNRVVIEGTYAPSPGQLLTVKYEVACDG